MNKKTAIALAVGALSATPALAQVEIYGRLYPQFTSAKTSGATVGAPPATLVGPGVGENHERRNSIDVSNSRIGFRGREQLGGGLSTIWQIETRVRFDSGTNSPWAGGRNSFLGLTGNFGTVKLGNMDTIYKEYGGIVGSFFGISSGNIVSSSNVLSVHGLAEEDGDGFGDTGFHIRAPSSIQYESPEFGAFQFGIQYMPDEAKGNPGRDFDSNLWSMGVKYEAGPLYVSLQHERHNDWLDLTANADGVALASTGSRDQATRLSVGYRLSQNHRITGDLARMEWKDSGPGGDATLEKTSWAIGWEARWGGPWRTEITYVANNDGSCDLPGGAACSTDGLAGNMLNLGVAYSLSKRTFIFGLLNKVTSKESAIYNSTANIDTTRGADITQLALGMSHSF
jgi:predicted porin